MGDVLFTNVRVLDGDGNEPFAGEVLVRDNRIQQIARGGESIAAPGAETVDGGGGTLMPGLIESHSHVSFLDTASLEALGEVPPEEHTLLTMKNARKFLDQGFTSMNSAAAAKPRLDVVIRNAINDGTIVGPRMLAASPELTVTGGLGDRPHAAPAQGNLRHRLRRAGTVPPGCPRNGARGGRHLEDQPVG